MKGFSHFVGGLAVASFFPAAVEAAAKGVPWYFVIGGVAALLPDTVDFKFLRFFFRHDHETDPGDIVPNPAPLAGLLARAVKDAADSGKSVAVKLNTLPLEGHAWQQYSVRFDPANRSVSAVIGPIVSTSQRPIRQTSATGASATVKTEVQAYPSYTATTTVDILDGPVLAMIPQPDGRVKVDFIPWHRSRSHSLVVGLLPGLLAGAAWNPIAGAVALTAFGSHILIDQLGFMGSNLWYPFTRQRTRGLQWIRSMDPFANVTMVWISLILILWNLSKTAGPDLAYSLPRMLFFGAALPILAVRLLTR